jgi:hypothetical protein
MTQIRGHTGNPEIRQQCDRLGGITFLARPERVFGANDRVRIAVVGLRGRGWSHVESTKIPNVEVVAFCDVDESVLGKARRC